MNPNYVKAVLGPTSINIGSNSYINLKYLKDPVLNVFITTGICNYQIQGANISPITGSLLYLAGTKGWWQGIVTGGGSLPLIANNTYSLTVVFQQPPTYYQTWQAQVVAQYLGTAPV